MSRCFPFPPPGYEKKPRPEVADILKEEKQKEKKPKREKKEKEKREGKEKRDKERNDEKHRDKRDRKEKQKDKKDKHREKKKEKEKNKDKDKSKEKDKSSTSEMGKVTGVPEARSGEKLNLKNGMDNSYCSDENNCGAKFHGQNMEKPIETNLLARGTEESKFVQELGRRIRDEKAAGDQSEDKFLAAEKKRDDETWRFAVRNPGDLAEDKGKSKDTRFDNKLDGQGIREEIRFSGNSMVQSFAGTAKGKVEVVPQVLEKIDERKMEGKDKVREKDDKRGDKHKNKEGDKKTYGKDKDKEKERKKEEKAKEKCEFKKYELDRSMDVNRSDLNGLIDKKSSTLASNDNSNANVDGNFKKRKDRHTNGFLHDNEIRPRKLPQPASHPMMENARKLEACQTPCLSISKRQGIPNIKVDNKDERKNGMIELQSLPTSKAKPKPPPVTAADQIAEASRKPPHPDSKFLSQVLSVPKMDEWSEFDDQEWLFRSQDPPSRKPEVRYPDVGEERQVWRDALHIESADIVALPYVLPY